MEIRYEITHVDNAAQLDDYVPVTGRWIARHCAEWNAVRRPDSDCNKIRPSGTSVVEAVGNWMDADFPIRVQLFHADGREITGDMPWEGTFVATRQG